ncbi:MAG: NAD-dependent epimerase/dehydratase family protein, partial [Thermoleophilia bacterium]|nr:NAD-dependent epimerase/dehydratase family protein [Thermoleophilia bacterium]
MSDRPSRGLNILVTGANGFVGANLVRRLLADGHSVTATVRPGSDQWRLDGVSDDVAFAAVDLRDPDDVAATVRDARPDWVMHLAAHGAYSWQTDVQAMADVNVKCTAAILEQLRVFGGGTLIHAGSSSEYGLKDHPPVENEAIDPNSPYAVTKAAATHLCRHVARTTDVDAVTLRLYSVYGPWEEPNRLMPALVEHCLRGELPPLVDPSTARDFVYADDVCDAFVRSAESAAELSGAVFNVGSGTQTRLDELVALARERFGVECKPAWGSICLLYTSD